MIKALLFDLDETLINRKETMRLFLLEQHATFELSTACDAEAFAELCLDRQKNGYADKLVAYREACSSLQLPDDLPEQLLEYYQKHYGKMAIAFPGIVETIAQLSQHYPLGIVSNGRTQGQMGKMQHVGLLPYFDSIIISESFGKSKPDPSLFLACLQELGVSPQNALFVGDNPEADITPAKSIGMTAIWIKNLFYSPSSDCDAAIDSVRELPSLLARWAS